MRNLSRISTVGKNAIFDREIHKENGPLWSLYHLHEEGAGVCLERTVCNNWGYLDRNLWPALTLLPTDEHEGVIQSFWSEIWNWLYRKVKFKNNWTFPVAGCFGSESEGSLACYKKRKYGFIDFVWCWWCHCEEQGFILWPAWSKKNNGRSQNQFRLCVW